MDDNNDDNLIALTPKKEPSSILKPSLADNLMLVDTPQNKRLTVILYS